MRRCARAALKARTARTAPDAGRGMRARAGGGACRARSASWRGDADTSTGRPQRAHGTGEHWGGTGRRHTRAN